MLNLICVLGIEVALTHIVLKKLEVSGPASEEISSSVSKPFLFGRYDSNHLII